MKKFGRLLVGMGVILLTGVLLAGCFGGGGSNNNGDDNTYDTFQLTVNIEGNGTVVPEAGTHEIEVDTIVNLEAIPASGYEFSHWLGDVGNENEAETTINMNENKEVTAVFTSTSNGEGEAIALDFVDVPSGTSSGYLNWPNISIGHNFEMSTYLTTNAQYLDFLNDMNIAADGYYAGQPLIDISKAQIGHNGEEFYLKNWEDADGKQLYTGNHPVIYVSWYGAVVFCNWLSAEEGYEPAYDLGEWDLENNHTLLEGYRLPTASEWEYAGRGGYDGLETKYAGSNELDDIAWYLDNSDASGNSNLWPEVGRGTMPVGLKEPNELGLYDMTGNLIQWTDTFNELHQNYDRRGGSWRSSDRLELNYDVGNDPETTVDYIGFRVVRTK